MITSKSMTRSQNTKGMESLLLAFITFLELRAPMGKYSYGNGRRKAVEKFTIWQWLMLVGVISGILLGFVVLWMHGYLNFDAH
jgi:hypothetical protein